MCKHDERVLLGTSGVTRARYQGKDAVGLPTCAVPVGHAGRRLLTELGKPEAKVAGALKDKPLHRLPGSLERKGAEGFVGLGTVGRCEPQKRSQLVKALLLVAVGQAGEHLVRTWQASAIHHEVRGLHVRSMVEKEASQLRWRIPQVVREVVRLIGGTTRHNRIVDMSSLYVKPPHYVTVLVPEHPPVEGSGCLQQGRFPPCGLLHPVGELQVTLFGRGVGAEHAGSHHPAYKAHRKGCPSGPESCPVHGSCGFHLVPLSLVVTTPAPLGIRKSHASPVRDYARRSSA